MLIRDLENKTGLERATIRFYEKEGLITPERRENGYRTYSKEDCDTLLKIKLLRQLGMPLDTIKSLQRGSTDFSTALDEQIMFLESQIQNAERAKRFVRRSRTQGPATKRWTQPITSKRSCARPSRCRSSNKPHRPTHGGASSPGRSIFGCFSCCVLSFLL